MNAPHRAGAAAGWQCVALDAVAPQPWRNGGGTTRELLAWPDAAAWRVRLSVAEVGQSGPFSRFEGVLRWFAVLSGEGVRLTVDGVSHVLHVDSAPFAFPGDAPTECALLGGPTRDFNLMTRGMPATMLRLEDGAVRTADPGTLVAVFALAATRLASAVAPCALPAAMLAWRRIGPDAPLSVRLDGGPALWMEIPP